jgi:hypothetical protein
MNIVSNYLASGIAFILTLAFGVWLSLMGKPYNGVIFNIHKLSALAAVILTAVQIYRALTVPGGLQNLPILLIVLAVACLVVLFASGALMSLDKWSYKILLALHQVGPAVALIAVALAVYLLQVQR